jgi:hypothetical protein
VTNSPDFLVASGAEYNFHVSASPFRYSARGPVCHTEVVAWETFPSINLSGTYSSMWRIRIGRPAR